MTNKEQMNIVIVGHVDHGKSTVIGRLLADTDSLPKGKLAQVQENCKRNAKPFEYAFLLDALKDEQSQGITIDIARCFFKTKSRDYIILDAPGHIEFLKNMVTGAAHAEAALLVIDAQEGIQENSKRHGYMISMLGIKQVAILINKMDLVNYSQEVFTQIQRDYTAFLKQINVTPVGFIPISARDGENVSKSSKQMSWYSGQTILQQVDAFKKQAPLDKLPFRLPVQDIYKFTLSNDDRRIIAGTIEAGKIAVGDPVVFYPSGKKTTIKSIEAFNAPVKTEASVEEAVGFTMTSQIYIKPGELMVRATEQPPQMSNRFKANIFWIGKAPLIKNKSYKLKLAAARTSVKLVDILSVLDASELSRIESKKQIDRLDVAECIFETTKPIAFDLVDQIEKTARFVLIDNYEIAGGGIVLESLVQEDTVLSRHIQDRELIWEKGAITPEQRAAAYHHHGKCVVITGLVESGNRELAKGLEKKLFEQGMKAYYLGISNITSGLEADIIDKDSNSDEHIRRLGELARIITDSGQIFITTIPNADDYDLKKIKLLNQPNEILVVNVGENNFNEYVVDLNLNGQEAPSLAVTKIYQLLKNKEIISEYYI